MDRRPFIDGNLVKSGNFLNREIAIRKTVSRIVSGGQSTLVSGEPRTGKTSLLHLLMDSRDLYSQSIRKMHFSYVDVDTLPDATVGGFWEKALEPFWEDIEEFPADSALPDGLAVCKEAGYGVAAVEKLIRSLKAESRQLVLLVDEIDRALHHEGLNNAGFYGGLRSVASRGGGAFAVVLASRLSQRELDVRTQVLSPSGGSPFFNIYRQVTLGPFPEKHIEALLDRAGDRFSAADRALVRRLGGGHPFLLQATAAAMWEAYDEPIEDQPERHRQVRKQVYREHKALFSNTWRAWTPEKRKTFTTVALANAALLLPGREFLSEEFVAGLKDYAPELDELEEAGQIVSVPQVLGGWRVASEAMLRWLVDELIRSVRTETSFDEWLRAQELDRFEFTRAERDRLAGIVRAVTGELQKGWGAFVDSFAKGLGGGLSNGVTGS